MSRFGAEVSRLEAVSSTFTLEALNRCLPQADLERVLEESGRASLRRRALPADFVVWLVFAGWLWRPVGQQNLLEKLARCFTQPLAWMKRGLTPCSAAVARARRRLGFGVFRRLFRHVVERWWSRNGDALRWHGLCLVALDGTTLRMQDTAANRRHFGIHRARRASACAYPFARVLVAMCVTSRVVLEFVVGRCHSSELRMALGLLGRLPVRSLLVLDRGFLGYALLQQAKACGHEFVLRAKKGLRYRVVRRLGSGDHVVRIKPSRALRRAHPDMPSYFEVRKIRYHVKGFKPVTLFTSLMDDAAFPAQELVALYRERWEIELTFDEIKTHLVATPVHTRSLSPSMVRQEIEALMITYNAIRMDMAEVALEASVPANRLSFTQALELLRGTLSQMAQAPTRQLPSLYAKYRQRLAGTLLPPRRPRSYRRERKGYGSPYPSKRQPRAA